MTANANESTPVVLLPEEHESLTRYEWAGLVSEHNLADGHARRALSQAESRVVDRLSEIFREAEVADQFAAQSAFESAFYRRAGQPSVLERKHPPLHHYSSSLSTEVVANHLRAEGLRVALTHPTFDNIAAILRRHNIPLRSVGERLYTQPGDPAHYEGADALFVVMPNNPTATDPEPDVLRTIADQCCARDMLLIIDTSFRFFSEHLHTWDQYRYFEQTGLRHVGIEDTGKTWPTLDLKAGSLVADPVTYEPLQRITDDCLLNVSPFIFCLLRELIEIDHELDCRRVAQANRRALADALHGAPVRVEQATGPMSVAWLRVPDDWLSAAELCTELARHGVAVLPGSPFFWETPEDGDKHLRVALMRPEDDFARGVSALRRALDLVGAP
jgi:aspartate/methionine/tyrosine aminotransferase